MGVLSQSNNQEVGLTCGNCGGVVAPGDVVCPSCGALLAAYQAPAGASQDASFADAPTTMRVEASRTDTITADAIRQASSPVDSSIPAVPAPRPSAPVKNTPVSAPAPSTPRLDPIGDALRAMQTTEPPSMKLPARQDLVNVIAQRAHGQAASTGAALSAASSGRRSERSSTPPTRAARPTSSPSRSAHGPARAAWPDPVSPDVTPDPVSSAGPRSGRSASTPPWRIGQTIPFVLIGVIILTRASSSSGRAVFPLIILIAIIFLAVMIKSTQKTARKTTHMPRDQRRRDR